MRTLFLTILILLSFFLSWNIIYTDENEQVEEEAITQTTAPQPVTFERELASVFGPSQVILREENQSLSLNPDEVFLMFQESDSELSFSTLSLAENINIRNLMVTDSLAFFFDEKMPFNIFSRAFSDLPSEYGEVTFDIMFIPVDDSNRVYFINFEDSTVYLSQLENVSSHYIAHVLRDQEINTRVEQLFYIAGRPFYLPAEEVNVPYRDFLIEQLPNSFFVDILFEDTYDVEVRYFEDSVRYTDYYSELYIDEVTNILTYNRQSVSNGETSVSSILERSYRTLLQVENWLQPVRFENYNLDNGIATFRRYVQGYPVMGDNGEGRIEIGAFNNRLYHLALSLNIAQTPIDLQETDEIRVLESGYQIVDVLENAELDASLIDEIRIGLRWEYSDESSRVVHFIPEWYINYNGEWYILEEFKN